MTNQTLQPSPVLTSKRSKFSLPPQVAYLNCAYMSPLLKDVEKIGVKSLRKKRNPASITAADFFTETEILRKEYAKLIHLTDPKRIVVIPSVSYGLATVTKNIEIKKDQHILVAAEQFPSNYYPWKSLSEEKGCSIITVTPPDDFVNRGKGWNEKILNAINAKTKVVAIGNVHWADGTLFNLEEIRRRTNDVGALLIIDGTQSVGAMPFDVEKIQPDALICAGYKWLLGPYSIGLAYYGKYFDDGKPIEENWINRLYSEDFTGLVSYQDAYQEGALRYEVGEHSNFNLVPMLHKAVQQLNNWGPERIQQYCRHISAAPVNQLKEKGFIIEDENWRSSHLFGIRLPQTANLDTIKQQLLRYKVYVSYRGNAIRVSPNVYNTSKDLQKLVKVLVKAV